MSIDLESERLVALREAPKHIPGRPHLSCIYRWMQREANPLETVLVGGRRFTSIEAIWRFIAGCNEPAAMTPPPMAERRRRQIEAAEAELRKAGIV